MRYQYVVVVGAGRLGSILANRISRLGSSVVVVDRDEGAFRNLDVDFSGFKVTGDAAEMAVLLRAGVDRADCVLAITPFDNVNLMVAQVAREMFHVERVIARNYDPAREAIYHEMGVETICPTRLAADAFLDTLDSKAEEKRT
ncbi:MAG: TrkA family potassium uptake protein [Anaerolineae bacterium]|nr:TrkA family potassium uptake protein [Anaerolineae bacterium]